MPSETYTLPTGLRVRRYVCDPALQVYGATAHAFIHNIGSEIYRALAEARGLVRFDLDGWYPLQPIFDLFNEIVQQENGNTHVFVAMGMRIAEQSAFPAEMQNHLTLVGILEGWQAHYEANHRGAPLPPVTTTRLSGTHFTLTLKQEHLYPYDLVYGMAYGFCRLLLPRGTRFHVAYDEAHNPYTQADTAIVVDVRWDAHD